MMARGGNDDVAVTLRHVDEVRRRIRVAAHPAWFPMVVFGLLGLASAMVCGRGGLHQGHFWAVAGPVGGALTSLHYQRRTMATGAGVRGGPYWAVAGGIFAAAWLAGGSNSRVVETAGPMVAVALGYLLFARLERSWPVAVSSAVLALVALGVGVAGVGNSCVVLSLTFGAVFTATGLAMRLHERG